MIVAFVQSELKEAKDLEAVTGMDLHFISKRSTGICRIYYKFFNDIDAATDFFFNKHKLKIVNTSGFSNCLMKFAYDLKFITIYDIEQVFRTIETYQLVEKIEI